MSAAAVVEQATARTGEQKSFHFVLHVDDSAPSSEGLSLTFADGDVIVPDRLKAKVAGTYNGIPLDSHVVFAGDRQFLENPLSGRWQSFSTNTSPIAFFSPVEGVLSVIRNATELKVSGTKTCGDGDCYVLDGKVGASALTSLLGNEPSERKADVELLVSKEGHLLRRLRLEGPVADGEPDSIARTVDISRYGEHVVIEAPAAG